MYERFTDRARHVMQHANQEAQRLQHEYISPDHILLGLLHDSQSIAGQVLKNLGADTANLRNTVLASLTPGPDMVTMGKLPQTPETRRVIGGAIDIARHLGHGHVGTEHMLFALAAERDDISSRALAAIRMDGVKIVNEIQRIVQRSGIPVIVTTDAVECPTPTPPVAPTAPPALAVGEKVMLASGGASMTISAINEERAAAWCVWLVEGKVHRDTFPLACLCRDSRAAIR